MILGRTESSAPTSPRTVTIGALSKLPCMVVRQGGVENETRAGNTTDAILGGSLGAASMPPRRQRGYAWATSTRPASPRRVLSESPTHLDVCDDEESPQQTCPQTDRTGENEVMDRDDHRTRRGRGRGRAELLVAPAAAPAAARPSEGKGPVVARRPAVFRRFHFSDTTRVQE